MSACGWCETKMPASSRAKRFCSSLCRISFHDACRRVGARLHREGKVTLAELHAEQPDHH